MASHHGLANRKVLLPFEAELCNTLGLSKAEYFEYLERASLTPVRNEFYALVPDVKNELTTALVIAQVVIGVALTAASALMAQKPSQKKPEPINVQKGDQIGQRRFTPSSNFGSVQDLARLGQTVPLIFADQSDNYGGTRANALLTLSCLSSMRNVQRIRTVAVTSLAELAEEPDYQGIAIGDQLLRDYSSSRVLAFYRKESGNIEKTDKYEIGDLDIRLGDKLTELFWHPVNNYVRVFCGTRTPSNKTEFGMYAPMSNGNYWKLDFQMFINPDANKEDDKNRIKRHREKIETKFPLFSAVTDIDDDIVTYEILGDDGDELFERYYDEYEGVGPEDIRNQVNEQRTFYDDNISEGELYALNNRVAVCIQRPVEQYQPGQENNSVYKFRYVNLSEVPGEVDRDGSSTVKEYDLKPAKGDDDNPVAHWEGGNGGQILRFADAIVANNQTCDCTEIGISSTVWKKLAGANINNFPSGDVITEMENNDAGGTYDIGRMDLYVPRYSFFLIQYRLEGTTEWESSYVRFAVRGEQPVEQHNAIRIYHPRGQHEFRFRPLPSRLAYVQNVNSGRPVCLLRSRKGLDVRSDNLVEINSNNDDGVRFICEGLLITEFTDESVRNPEAYKGRREAKGNKGVVIGLSPSSSDPENNWVDQPKRPQYDGPPDGEGDGLNTTGVRRRDHVSRGTQQWGYYWEGDKVYSIPEVPLSDPIKPNKRIAPISSTLRYRAGDLKYQNTNTNTGTKIYWYEIIREINKIGDKVPVGGLERKSTQTVSGNGKGLEVDYQEYSDGTYSWTIADRGEGYKTGDKVRIRQPIDKVVTVTAANGETIGGEDDPGWWNQGDMYPYHAVSDYRHRDTESCSNTDNPEHRIAYVNEIIDAPDDAVRGTYKDLASIALIINSSREINTLDQISAYYKEGIKVRKLGKDYSGSSKYGPSNIFPEIAFFLLTDRRTGAGAVIDQSQIDIDSFIEAADYCRANDFYWDGVIDERVNLREFLYEQATYCLLDFTMKGGRFGLTPAVPTDDKKEILRDANAKPPIKALFSDGNINQMKVSTLPPEDRKLFEAEVLFRKEKVNKFPETRTTNVRLFDYTTQAIETYDMTQFCTSRRQTIQFAKYALMVRKWLDHTIEFQTTPESAAGIEPGDYVRVVSHVCHPSRFQNGCVTAEGVLVTNQPISSGTEIYYWRPGFPLDASTNSYIKVGKMTYSSDGKADNALRGCVFSVINETSTDRVYKVDSLSIGEEGFVQLVGSHMPVTDDGALEIMQGWDADENFIINDTES